MNHLTLLRFSLSSYINITASNLLNMASKRHLIYSNYKFIDELVQHVEVSEVLDLSSRCLCPVKACCSS